MSYGEILEKLDLMILGDIYRALFSRDRLPDDILNCESLEPDVGLPMSANDLKLPGQQLRGEALVRRAYWCPTTLARAHLNLTRKAPRLWTEEEAEFCAVLESRIQTLFRKWEAEGLVIREPPISWEGKDRRAEGEMDAWVARVTTKGIEEARKRVPGTPFERSPLSLLWSMPEELRKKAPQWAQKEFQAEGGVL